MLKKQFNSVIVFLLLSAGFCSGQSTDSIVQDISIIYSGIHENYKSYDTTVTELVGESSEGGEAIAYYDNLDLKLIEVTYFGETGWSKMEYYFGDRQLLFVLETTYFYNRPIYWDKDVAKEHKDTEVYDPAKTTSNENRYYIHKGKLIRWLDNDKKEVNLSHGTNSITGERLIAQAYKIKHGLRK